MIKKVVALLVTVCIVGMPIHTFAATKNYMPYIRTAKKDEVIVGKIVIDNSDGDLKVGDYFSVSLEGAEFDLGDDRLPRIYGESIEFRHSTGTGAYGEVLESRNKYTVSFFSKINTNNARIILKGEDSGLSSGEYVFAITSETGEAYKGTIEHTAVILKDKSSDLNPIIIKEPYTAAFRTLVNDKLGNEALIKIELESKDFELMEAGTDKPITLVVNDGKNTTSYRLGYDHEVDFNYRDKTITFSRRNSDIFGIDGENYSIELKNVKLNSKGSDIKDQDINFKLSGLLVEEQNVTIAKKISESLVLDTSEEEIKPGEKHLVGFTIQESIPGALFSEGYIDLGVRGGAIIDNEYEFVLKLNEGDKTYTEKDFDIVLDPQKDQVRIKGFKRKGSKELLTIVGEFTIGAPERVIEEIYMFINDPSVELAKQRILTAAEEIIQPPIPSTSKVPTVQFTLGQDAYILNGEAQSMDARAYSSIHDRIMVPLRYVAYALGVDPDDLKWDGPSQIVTLEGDKSMTINMETGTMIVDGKASGLSETRLMGGRTFVPVGEIGRAFGIQVHWDPDNRTATFN